MIFKNALLALTLFSAAAAQKDNIRQQKATRDLTENTPGLSIDEFLKAFDDGVSDMASAPGQGRKLQGDVMETIDEEVTKDQVVAALTRFTKPKDGQKPMFRDCIQLFRHFDANDDGVLDLDELVELFLTHVQSPPLAKKYAQTLLLWYDKRPTDGFLSLREIKAACKGGENESDTNVSYQ